MAEQKLEASQQSKNKFKGDVTSKNLKQLKELILNKVKLKVGGSSVYNFISKPPNFNVHGKHFRFSEKSLFLFSSENRFRIGVVWIMESHYFDRFIIFIIISNTIILCF